MHTDPIADFVIRIKNGYMAKKPTVSASYSKVKAEIGKLLKHEGFIDDIKKEGSELVVTLRYDGKEPVLNGVTRISKPGLRVYVNKKNVPSVLKGRGIALVSTSHGLMTDKEARAKGKGGELLLKVW